MTTAHNPATPIPAEANPALLDPTAVDSAAPAPLPTGPTPPVVEFVSVARSFPGPPTVHALHATDLIINTGDYLSIVGPSGSGKSTMLNLLGLLDRPTSGDYLLNGELTSTLTEDERAHLRGTTIGFVFQSFHLMPRRSVLDNVILATMYSGLPRSEREPRAVEALERVNLSHRLNFLPGNLSGGERQRVAVARAVVTGPRLLLADEPTGNLDHTNSREVMNLFDELHADGLNLVVITHDTAVAERAARQVRITHGTLREER
ncbi:ABC transporter ATP-binding protein [Lysinibacter sp. HNR]|uniref:ABC transporter ATP-binding protein n=1 Tax=Lysinibacter sp. HNR TaxID=3031408 RepID=UPI00243519C2|nr:ABC transporter ATP-binding protein [Lysinibacter sp. HNR]WGD37110.1 ABC transporter ATP-binding protein [Lysinibacter sp. HNR]